MSIKVYDEGNDRFLVDFGDGGGPIFTDKVSLYPWLASFGIINSELDEALNQMRLKGHTCAVFGLNRTFMYTTEERGTVPWAKPVEELKCECGAVHVKSNYHSTWCPKYLTFGNA